jgi:DNA modification methylase
MKYELYEGDCLKHIKTLKDKSIDMILTDPPYNIDYKPARQDVKNNARHIVANDNLNETDFVDWLDEVVFEMDRVLKDDSYIFMFSGWSTIYQFQPVLMKYWEVKAIHIWYKNMFGIGYYSRPQYEPFFMCLKGKPDKPEKAHSDVWEFPKVKNLVHTCEKPRKLLEEIISVYGKPGMKILDPFAGSGSLGLAAYETGTIPIMMELESNFCKIIEQRIGKLKPKKDKVNKQKTLF